MVLTKADVVALRTADRVEIWPGVDTAEIRCIKVRTTKADDPWGAEEQRHGVTAGFRGEHVDDEVPISVTATEVWETVAALCRAGDELLVLHEDGKPTFQVVLYRGVRTRRVFLVC